MKLSEMLSHFFIVSSFCLRFLLTAFLLCVSVRVCSRTDSNRNNSTLNSLWQTINCTANRIHVLPTRKSIFSGRNVRLSMSFERDSFLNLQICARVTNKCNHRLRFIVVIVFSLALSHSHSIHLCLFRFWIFVVCAFRAFRNPSRLPLLRLVCRRFLFVRMVLIDFRFIFYFPVKSFAGNRDVANAVGNCSLFFVYFYENFVCAIAHRNR